MPRKRIPLSPTRVLIPANLDLANLAARVGCKADVIAVLLHQIYYRTLSRDDLDLCDWVPLQTKVLRKLYRRSQDVLAKLEGDGVIEVQRNAAGRKSYITGKLAVVKKVRPTSARYRLHPNYHTEAVFHTLTERTVWKAFHANITSAQRQPSPREPVQNGPHEVLDDTHSKKSIEIDKTIQQGSIHQGHFVPDLRRASTEPKSITSDLKQSIISERAISTSSHELQPTPHSAAPSSRQSVEATTDDNVGHSVPTFIERGDEEHYRSRAAAYANSGELFDAFFAGVESAADCEVLERYLDDGSRHIASRWR